MISGTFNKLAKYSVRTPTFDDNVYESTSTTRPPAEAVDEDDDDEVLLVDNDLPPGTEGLPIGAAGIDTSCKGNCGKLELGKTLLKFLSKSTKDV